MERFHCNVLLLISPSVPFSIEKRVVSEYGKGTSLDTPFAHILPYALVHSAEFGNV